MYPPLSESLNPRVCRVGRLYDVSTILKLGPMKVEVSKEVRSRVLTSTSDASRLLVRASTHTTLSPTPHPLRYPSFTSLTSTRRLLLRLRSSPPPLQKFVTKGPEISVTVPKGYTEVLTKFHRLVNLLLNLLLNLLHK